MRLEGKTALITGAGGGMGRVAAVLFAKEGANVIATDISRDGLAVTEALVAEHAHGSILTLAGDVANEADVESWVRGGIERYGALHVLYNNAGIFPDDDKSVLDMTEDAYRRTLDVNLKGVWLGCKHGIPAMLESGGGSIVNVASFVAIMGAATAQIAYTSSKGGVLAMTREIAVEWARRGIRANALCPGPINTPMLAELMADPERRARRLVHIPMGRLGEAEELAKAALFLASDESSYMTGASLVVDGGIPAAYVTPE